jgi:hypothetical protein
MELIAPKSFLMAVLNEGKLHGRNDIWFNAAFLDLDLVRLDIGKGEIESIITIEAYQKVVSDILNHIGDPILSREVPAYSDFKEALQSSLLLPPDNLAEFMKELRLIELHRNQPSRFPKQACVAIDTNIAYYRLLSRLLLTSEACGVPDYDPSSIQILIAELVEQEISEKCGRKYRENDLDILRKGFRNPRLLSNLMNACTKDGRKALNAQAELSSVRQRYNTWDVAGGQWNEDKEKRDQEIIGALAAHARREDLEVLFLSADDKASSAAKAFKLPIMVLRYPYEVPRTLAYDPWLVVELLYDLSIIYGIVSIRGLGVKVFGDWAGKTAEDYRQERVKVVLEESSSLNDAFARDWRALEKIRAEAGSSGVRH